MSQFGPDIPIPLPQHEELVKFASGGVSSKVPRLQLVWLSSVIALANRMEYGFIRKGSGACNAINPNDVMVRDEEFVIDRLAHSALHSMQAIARLMGHLPPLSQEEQDAGGDEGAIMFGGALLAEHRDLKKREGLTSK